MVLEHNIMLYVYGKMQNLYGVCSILPRPRKLFRLSVNHLTISLKLLSIKYDTDKSFDGGKIGLHKSSFISKRRYAL